MSRRCKYRPVLAILVSFALLLMIFSCLNVVSAFTVRNQEDISSSLIRSNTSQSKDMSLSESTSSSSKEPEKRKRIILTRHGRTYMNEYLSSQGSNWGDPNFTDIFDDNVDDGKKYLDSPLSSHGEEQARKLAVSQLLEQDVWDDVELVVVSPLTRTLQTLEMGVLPNLKLKKTETGRLETSSNNNKNNRSLPLIVALPLATERVYLISDIGKKPSELSKTFPYVDFESEFSTANDGKWWYHYPSDEDEEEEYVEWRPCAENQTYACPGETPKRFKKRMNDLYDWLENRPESTIAIVAHWGVIRWLVGEEFDNCETRVFDFYKDIKRDGYLTN